VYRCAQDLLEYLMATTSGGAQDTEHRALRAAAGNGYRDVLTHHDWTWLDTAITVKGSDFTQADGTTSLLLPRDCKNVDALVAPDRTTATAFMTVREYNQLLAYDVSPGSTIFWTVVPDRKQPDRMRMLIGGRNSPMYEDMEYILTYRRAPQPLRYFGYEKRCRDSQDVPDGVVLRWGSPTQYPEGPYGINSYAAEMITPDTETLQGTPPNGGRTSFSDFLDVPDYLFSAVLSASEVWYARLTGNNVEGALTVHSRDMRLAMEQDGLAPMSGRRRHVMRSPEGIEMPYASTGTARQMGYYSPEQPDTGTNISPTGGTPNPPTSFKTTDKPHSVGYQGPPIQSPEPWLNPWEAKAFGSPAPDDLTSTKVGEYKIDPLNNKWVFTGGDPKDKNNWGLEQ